MKKTRLYEIYKGLGIRMVHIDHDAGNEQITTAHLWDEWVTPMERVEGRKVKPNFVFGFKIGYKLLK